MDNMQWQKNFGPHLKSYQDFLLICVGIMILLASYFREPILYVATSIVFIYVVINRIYNHVIGRKLYLDNTPQTIRMFQGEQGKLSFELENRSILPFIHGQFRVPIEPILKSLDADIEPSMIFHAFQKSFSIKAKGKTEVVFPFQAQARGTARVSGITYTIPHLFHFDTISLRYLPVYFLEVIVFPKPLPIDGIETAFQMSSSEERTNLSPFEDIQSPIGTRDYEFSDPFHRINWKASAKTQQLQTNLYEKVIDKSYLFIVNIRRNKQLGIQTNHLMEQMLSYTTYLCRYALKYEFPYEMYINARTESKASYLHLSEGKGRAHYIRSLEMLAKIPKYTMTYSFTKMISRIRKQVTSPKTIVIIGDTPEELIPVLERWSRVQQDIFHVVSHESGATLERWSPESVLDVKLYA